MWPKGKPTDGINLSGTGWILAAAAIICVLFAVWLLIDAWRVRRRIQREFGNDQGARKNSSALTREERAAARSREHIEMTCRHCKKGILVPRARRFSEVECPACGEGNPAPRKDPLAFPKDILRWLLYPSFQRKD
jgi:hypothetical protein